MTGHGLGRLSMLTGTPAMGRLSMLTGPRTIRPIVLSGLDPSSYNPGNIEYNVANQWYGQTGQDTNGFAVFNSMINGMRAMAGNLYNGYFQKGINTPQGIATTWGQPTNAQNIANTLGIGLNDAISPTRDNYHKLIYSIIVGENSQGPTDNAISDNDIEAALTSASIAWPNAFFFNNNTNTTTTNATDKNRYTAPDENGMSWDNLKGKWVKFEQKHEAGFTDVGKLFLVGIAVTLATRFGIKKYEAWRRKKGRS